MSHELHYTSAPRGLKPGSRGFCTVARTAELSTVLAERLESLSGYRQVFPPHHPSEALNPVVFAHVRIGGADQCVLSRIGFAGLDYSDRANKYAHHIVLAPAERPRGGPAWLLAQPGFLQDHWEGEPRMLAAGRIPPSGDRDPGVCHEWQRLTGDAGWAGAIAQSFLDQPDRPAYVVFEPGMNVLSLFVEALALLPAGRRWQVTFSTYFTGIQPGVTCLWRGVVRGSPEAEQATKMPGALVIDLTRPGDKAPDSPLSHLARTGQQVVEPATPSASPDDSLVAVPDKLHPTDSVYSVGPPPVWPLDRVTPHLRSIRPPRLPGSSVEWDGDTSPSWTRRIVTGITILLLCGLLALGAFAIFRATNERHHAASPEPAPIEEAAQAVEPRDESPSFTPAKPALKTSGILANTLEAMKKNFHNMADIILTRIKPQQDRDRIRSGQSPKHGTPENPIPLLLSTHALRPQSSTTKDKTPSLPVFTTTKPVTDMEMILPPGEEASKLSAGKSITDVHGSYLVVKAIAPGFEREPTEIGRFTATDQQIDWTFDDGWPKSRLDEFSTILRGCILKIQNEPSPPVAVLLTDSVCTSVDFPMTPKESAALSQLFSRDQALSRLKLRLTQASLRLADGRPMIPLVEAEGGFRIAVRDLVDLKLIKDEFFTINVKNDGTSNSLVVTSTVDLANYWPAQELARIRSEKVKVGEKEETRQYTQGERLKGDSVLNSCVKKDFTLNTTKVRNSLKSAARKKTTTNYDDLYIRDFLELALPLSKVKIELSFTIESSGVYYHVTSRTE